MLVDGRQTAAVEMLDDRYTSVCATADPERIETAAGHTTVCHLYDDDVPGTSTEDPERVIGTETSRTTEDD